MKPVDYKKLQQEESGYIIWKSKSSDCFQKKFLPTDFHQIDISRFSETCNLWKTAIWRHLKATSVSTEQMFICAHFVEVEMLTPAFKTELIFAELTSMDSVKPVDSGKQ